MLSRFYPYARAKSVFQIEPAALLRQGYRAMIFDIDNTLVHHGDDATPEIEAYFAALHKTGMQALLLSNNDAPRCERFIKNMPWLPYICDAEKPDTKGYLRAAKQLGVRPEEAVVIGDQIFTDILGANRSGMASILVDFIRLPEETHIGKRRYLEYLILFLWRHQKKYCNRLDVTRGRNDSMTQKKQRKLFCEISPLTYAISENKEKLLRFCKNLFSSDKLAKTHSAKKLPCVVSAYSSGLIKTGKGIDPKLQKNKAVNIKLASAKINGLIIHPGETFSFWQTVGSITKRKGYRDGRILICNRLTAGLGGGLCNLANTIHYMVLHSPLTVTEFHAHSDALAPDHGKRVPFSSGTSVSYNYIDYRFRNDTDRDVQLLLWCADNRLYGELRSTAEFPWEYALEEEDHHFRKEGDKYYRCSKIYKVTKEKATGKVTERKLVRDNHSKVMFDPSEIPPELLRNDETEA